jgi:hypothetical protein
MATDRRPGDAPQLPQITRCDKTISYACFGSTARLASASDWLRAQ